MSLLHSGLYNVILEANTNAGFADYIPRPLLYILLGLGIIFAVLIFIVGLIYIIRFVFNLSNTKPEGTGSDLGNPADETVDAVLEDRLTDDLELVAVITAAIMASMDHEVPADGLIVRSIRRINNKRWQNA